MKTWMLEHWKSVTARQMLAAALAFGMAAGVGGYEMLKPATARAAVAAPAAAPLSEDSVNAITALDQAMETLAAHVTPAVVNVTVTARTKTQMGQNMPDDMRQFFGQFFGHNFDHNFGGRNMPETQVEHGLGSGFIVSPEGYIVTNNHVVKDATDIRVTLNDRRVLPAKLIGTDPLTDLAVIKIEGPNMPSLPWGDSTALRPGQTVLAFGNPFSLRFTVTRGIVSAVNRANPFSDDPRKPGEFIQTDAAINPGNSGGPLVDARGEVIGINTFLISPSGSFSGMGFAIPSQIARHTVETLVRYGKVDHAYMGIGISDVTPENAKFFHLSNNIGAVVTQVQADTPGAKAGLKIGDVITGFDGKTVSDAGQLQVLVGEQRPGAKITLDITRDGRNENVPVTLEEMSKSTSEAGARTGQQGKARWGLGLSNITPDVREELQLPQDVHGAVVQRVEPGSPADNAGISRGDVIVSVDRKPVESAADVQRELGSVPKEQDAMVLVWSNGGNTFRVMHSDGAGSSEGSGE